MLAVVALWMVFMIPSALRYRSQLVAAHADDRFSSGLRIVAGSKRAEAQNAVMLSELQQPVGVPGPGRSAGAIHATAARAVVVGEVRQGDERRKGHTMTGTVTMPAAVKARRAAAARRRAFLTVALLGITLGMIGASLATPMTMAAAAIPGVLLLSVLVMGRRAVIANARADARRGWTSASAAPRQAVTRPATSLKSPAPTAKRVADASTSTTVLPRVRPTTEAKSVAAPAATMPASLAPSFTMGSDEDADAQAEVVAEVAEVAESRQLADLQQPPGESDDAWQPVPTPRPTYVFKAPAPRREPRPLEAFDPAMLSAGAGRSASRSAEVEDAAASATAEGASGAAASTASTGSEPATTTLSGGLQLDAILARRRAIG